MKCEDVRDVTVSQKNSCEYPTELPTRHVYQPSSSIVTFSRTRTNGSSFVAGSLCTQRWLHTTLNTRHSNPSQETQVYRNSLFPNNIGTSIGKIFIKKTYGNITYCRFSVVIIVQKQRGYCRHVHVEYNKRYLFCIFKLYKKPRYRKDDRAMRHIMSALKIVCKRKISRRFCARISTLQSYHYSVVK